jgi:hypothetical protein
MNRPTRSLPSAVCGGALLLASLASTAMAGDPKAPLDKSPLEPTVDTGWDFTMVSPGWIAGAEGTIGVAGVNSSIDVTFADIIDNLGLLAAAGVEGRNGKLGFILEGSLYAKTAFGGTTPGPLLSTVEIGMEQLVAEGTLTYRFFESDRAWIELLAGARYTYMSTDLTLTTDAAGVAGVSQNLSEEIFDRATAAARQEVARRLTALTAGLAVPAADIPAGRLDSVENGIFSRNGGFRDSIRERINRGLGSNDTGIGERFPRDPFVRRALINYVEAKVEAEVEAARANASAAVGAARAGSRAAAERRLARAENALSNAIERRLNDLIPDSTLHASKAWVDPFIGFQGRCEINDRHYLVGRGDIGGFGISSDLAWNAYGALGTVVNDRTSIEVGYRYYQVEYDRGGFLYDVATKGPFLGVRIDF